MSIHSEHPFATPEGDRSAVRRLRGRLASPVTLWTAEHAGERAGLTVSSVLVADGEPGCVIGVLDPLSDLYDALIASGRAVVAVLGWPDRALADAFGYVAPAPGGPFTLGEFVASEWGPVFAGAESWAGCALSSRAPESTGWGGSLQLDIEPGELREPAETLVHRRGRYARF